MNELTLIGEKINYSIPRIGRLLDAGNLAAIRKVARGQQENGADYIDVNVGPLPPEVMSEVVAAVQEEVSVPLCIDSTDPALLEAGAAAYDAGREAGDGSPILNSAIESNAGRVLALRSRFDCRVVLLVSERIEGGLLERNVLPGQAVETARRLFAAAREAGFRAGEVFIDPGTPPVASDLEGLVNTALDTIAGVRSDPGLKGARIVIGLSNFTTGLPRQARLPLQNAFLTLAVEQGLDTLIGDPARDYRLLERGDENRAWLERILASTGTKRLEELTSYPLYRNARADDNGSKPPGGRGQGE
jgi:5-methyltetrahydrofolate--homocysteine methyltransferase